MFGSLFNVESMVEKYLIRILKRYAIKNGSKDGQVGIMLQLREEEDSILFSGWEIKDSTKFDHKEWLKEKEVIEMLKD